MARDLDRLIDETREALQRAATLDDLEAVRRRALGRRGAIAALVKGLPALPEADRAALGARINEARRTLEEALADRLADCFGASAGRGGLTQEELCIAAERCQRWCELAGLNAAGAGPG